MPSQWLREPSLQHAVRRWLPAHYISLAVWTKCLETGSAYEVEYRFRRASDGAYRWFIGRALPVRDDQGRIWFSEAGPTKQLVGFDQLAGLFDKAVLAVENPRAASEEDKVGMEVVA